MQETRQNLILSRQPLAALGKLTAAALLGEALFCLLHWRLIGGLLWF
jgi:hypothetical protein